MSEAEITLFKMMLGTVGIFVIGPFVVYMFMCLFNDL